jgi:thermostable 8-oxoguanine DNA glycosylase
MRAIDYSGDLKPFLDQYDYQPTLTEKLDNMYEMDLTQQSINEIVLWKVDRYVEASSDLLSELNTLRTLPAGEHRRGVKVLPSLLNTRGVDLPMASTLLRFRNPRVFQIIDRHAYRAVYGNNYPLYAASHSDRKIDVYFDYLDKLIELCRHRGLSFQSIDRLLYIFDKKENGKL